jgi:chromate reductase, NAD(P)H dehydrogenase (quinone)
MTAGLDVLGISGSLRARSYNSALLRAAAALAPPDLRVTIADIGAIPLYNADDEAVGFPPAVEALRERARAADVILIATPEYCFSVPGVLKNTLDWLTRPPRPALDDKPLGIMGAGGRVGTLRAQYHLRQIALNANMHALNRPELALIRAWEHFDAEGALTNEESREQLRQFLAALAVWSLRLLRR